MLSIKRVFYLSLLHYFVCGIENSQTKYKDIKERRQLSDSNPPTTPCGPEMSLHSRKDIKDMIDHIYNMKSLNTAITETYKQKAESVRDKHLKSLNDFTAWFKNQPEHLKHVLQSLTNIRMNRVEPAVEKVATVLNEYPKFEMSYKEKNDKTNQLVNRLKRYGKICQYNCEDEPNEVSVHNINKRNVHKDFHCSSIKDLHNEITQKLLQFVQKLNNDTNTKLSLNDKQYEEKIQKLKTNLKDKALQKFGRTMYDILGLEDDYQHYINELTSKELEGAVYSIKSLELDIDTKLLALENAVEKYGQYCNTCRSKLYVRNTREANRKSEEKDKAQSLNIVNELIEAKSNETKTDLENEWKNIFSNLDTLIEKSETEEENLENLKPIQDEVKNMTLAEKQALDKLQNNAPLISIQKILKLIKILIDFLKYIEEIIETIPIPTPVPSPIPTPVPSPIPTPVPSPIPTPVPSPIPTPVPSPIPTLIPTNN